MKINILKRGVILLIAVIMCLSTFVSVGALNAFADEVPEQDKTVVFSFPRDGDENYTAEWGHEELHYMNGWSQKESKQTHIYAIGSWEGNICYCIEPGTPIDNDQTVNSTNETYWDNYPSEYNKTITPYYIKLNIGRIMQYGYCGTVTTAWRSQNEEDADKMSHAIATQLLIWETIVGERDENFNHVDAGECDAILDTISVNHPLYDRIMTYYNSMVKSVQNHSKIPSFFKKSSSSAQSVTLSWNGSKYTATLTDTNNVLGNYTFTTNNSKVTCSVSGNKLTVSSSTAINSEVTITANKVNGKRKGMVVWGDGIYDTGTGDIQDLVTFSAEVDDPVVGYVKVKVSSGSAKIVKTSEDGKVSGVQFTVVGNGINTTVTTNANGEITVPNLTAGTYTVTEVVGNIYEPQESRTVTVVAGQTSTVTFNNTLKRGNLVVTKTSEDGLVSGVKFRLYGTSDSGIAVNLYATTNANGIAEFKNVLVGSNYTLEEVDVKAYYVTPVKQTGVKVEWNKVTNKSFDNVLKRGELKVVKTSEDDMVEGVKFRLYGTSDSGIAVNLYATTNANGIAEFKNVLVGSNYKLEEVDTKAYYITPSVQNATIEWNKVTNKSFSNTLKRGNLTVTKTAEDGMVSGVKFHLYGTSDSGIKVDEYATTNSKGVAEFKNILIGSAYTIEECNVSEKYITPIAQTNVVIEWEKVTQNTFENVLKRGDLKVTKTAEDGLVEGLTFHLYGYSISGIYVDEYAVTNGNGIAEFKDILIGSNYTLEESNCPDRYVVLKLQDAAIEWDKVCEINAYNELKKSTVIGKKVDEDGFTIAGALFGLFKPDEIVFTEETALMASESNEIGVFGFENVPYGNWIIRELKSAPAFVLNEEIFEVSITEDEQIIEITAVNRFICGCVRVWKLDEEVPDSKLLNAVFAVYCDVDGNGEFNAEIDMLVGELTELEAGFYGMDNLRYNGYFLHEEKAPDGFIKDDNYYHFEILNDGEVVYIENKTDVGFVNKPIKGELKILKIDGETKQPLANVGFRVMDADGNIIEGAYTDENGIVSFTLRYGEYTYCEFSPLEGYYETNEVYPFAIIEDGEVIEREFENDPIPDPTPDEPTPDEPTPDEPPTPQTGDESNMIVWFILLALSVVGIALSAKLILKAGR